MDWLIDSRDGVSTDRALGQLAEHLERYAADPATVGPARRTVAQALADGPHGLLRLHLDWTEARPWAGVATVPDAAAVADLRAGDLVPAEQCGTLGVNRLARVQLDVERWVPEPYGDVPAVTSPDDVPHLDLSLSLPRESASVPVVRRLAVQALTAFGVNRDDVSDVELAMTEACANVIEHAADTDVYEVKVELAGSECAITVVDQGSGSLATAVAVDPDVEAESGRGLALMRALVDNVAFRSEPRAGAVVHMVKTLHYEADHPLWRRATPAGSREEADA